MNWIDFLLGIYYSFLPERYWWKWRPSSTVDFRRSAMLSALVELLLSAVFLVRGCIQYLIVRGHQLSALAQSNEIARLYLGAFLILEYLFHPLSLLLLYFTAEGAARWFAAWSTEEVLPSAPVKIVSVLQEWYGKKQQEKRLGPIVPDVLERLQGTEYAIRVLSCRPIEGWRESITVVVDQECYELAKQGAGTGTHRFEYLLRKHPPGTLIRGMYRYEPAQVAHRGKPLQP